MLKNSSKAIFKNPIAWALIIILLVRLFTMKTVLDTGFKNHDMDQYYSYLPALIEHRDLTFNFHDNGRGYWVKYYETGKGCPKFTFGIAIMELPGYLLGFIIEKITGENSGGYSNYYLWSVALNIMLYVLIGLALLAKILSKYFSKSVVAITILSLFLCTNLYYYSLLQPFMSHASLFAINCIILYTSIRWFESHKNKHLFILALAFGMGVLIRPTNAVVIIVISLIGIYNKEIFMQRISLIRTTPIWKLIFALLLVLMPFGLQSIYWRYITGDFFTYTYQNEGFFWTDPKIFQQWFSFRNGWLIYSPFMVFSLVGFYFLYKASKNLFFAIFIYFWVNVYILSCWWLWPYTGAFGMRVYVESYVFLALPLAATVACFYKNLVGKVVLTLLLICFSILNTVQTRQAKVAIIHWSDNTFASYKIVFMKLSLTEKEREERDKVLKSIDYKKACNGERDF